MNLAKVLSTATRTRLLAPRLSLVFPLLQESRLAHRDAKSLLKEKPAKPTSLWMEYVKVQRLEVLEENPHLRGNDRGILGMVRDRFNALTPDEKAEVEVEYEFLQKEYYRRLHEWNAQLTPEESVAILRHEADVMKRDRDRTRRRIERQMNKKGKNLNHQPKATGEPMKPGGIFLGVFVPTLVRPESQPYREFLKEAADKWKNLPEAEKSKLWRIYYDRVAEYQDKFDCWLATKKLEDPSFDRKSWRKGVRRSSEEMTATRKKKVMGKDPVFNPNLSFDLDEKNQTWSIADEMELAQSANKQIADDSIVSRNSSPSLETPVLSSSSSSSSLSSSSYFITAADANSTPDFSDSPSSLQQPTLTAGASSPSALTPQTVASFLSPETAECSDLAASPLNLSTETATSKMTTTTRRKKSISEIKTKSSSLEPVVRPARPKNAFFVFKDSFQKSEFVEHKQLVQFISKQWEAMTEVEKKPYFVEARKQYDEYAAKMRKWGETQDDWRVIPRAHRDMSSVVREPFVRPFGLFITTLTRKEGETLGQMTRRAAGLWKELDDEAKGFFKEIFIHGKDTESCKLEWKQYILDRGLKEDYR